MVGVLDRQLAACQMVLPQLLLQQRPGLVLNTMAPCRMEASAS
jgi:hypothetical protein